MVVTSIYVLFVFIYTVNAAGSSFNVHWNYEKNTAKGPSNWTAYASHCGGNRQSPIDIKTEDATLNEDLGKIVLGHYATNLSGSVFELGNTGSSLNVKMLTGGSDAKNPIHVIHGGISYRFLSFHFHWGSINSQGSEHTIDGEAFPAELHMIHFNTKYNDVSEAVTKSDGLLVWGHLIKIGSANTVMNDLLFQYLNDVKFSGQTKVIPSFPFKSLIVPDSEDNYYTYLGSLTTPGCYESVKWIVNMKQIEVSQAQMDALRTLHNGKNTSSLLQSNNFRPVQNLKGRIVEKSSGATFIGASLLSIILPAFIGFVYRF